MSTITLTEKDGIAFSIEPIMIQSIICNSADDRRIETITGEIIYIRESLTDILKMIMDIKTKN